MAKKFTKLIPECQGGGGIETQPLYNLDIGFFGEFYIIGGMEDGKLTSLIDKSYNGYNDKAMGLYVRSYGTTMDFSGTLVTVGGVVVGDGGEGIAKHLNEPLFLTSDVSWHFDS